MPTFGSSINRPLDPGETHYWVVNTSGSDAVRANVSANGSPYTVDVLTDSHHPTAGGFYPSNYETALPAGPTTFDDTNGHVVGTAAVLDSVAVAITNTSGGQMRVTGQVERHEAGTMPPVAYFMVKGTGGRAVAYRDGRGVLNAALQRLGGVTIDGDLYDGGGNTIYDASAGEFVQDVLGGPAGDLSGYPLEVGTDVAAQSGDYTYSQIFGDHGKGDHDNTVPELDDNGVVLSSQIPDLAITQTNTVASETERLALDVEPGDVAIQQDTSETYIFTGGDPSLNENWSAFQSPPAPVQSVFGRTGDVSAQSGDYSYSQIDGTHGNADHSTNYASQSSLDTTQTNLSNHESAGNPHSASAGQNVGVENPVYASTSDVPSGITEGETVYISGDGLYVEDGT